MNPSAWLRRRPPLATTDPLDPIVPPATERSGWLARADRRLHDELARAGALHPSFARTYRWVSRYRLILLMAAAVARGIADGLGFSFNPEDLTLFSEAGTRLLGGDWADAFADAKVQTGPLQLVLYGIAAVCGDILHLPLKVPLSVLVTVSFTLGVVLVTRRVLSDRGRPSAGPELFVGATVLLGGVSWLTVVYGHASEGFIPLLWILAAWSARRSRPGRAGLLLGLAGGFKLWGVLAAPLLLMTPRRAGVLRGLACQAAVTAALYAPFVIFGDVNTFDHEWTVNPWSPLRFLVDPGAQFTWAMRLGQAVVIVLAAACLAQLGRRLAAAEWAVPLGIVAARLLVDPVDYHYFWAPVGTIALIGCVTLLPRGVSWAYAPAGAAFYLTLMPFYLFSDLALAGYLGASAIALLVAVAWVLRDGSIPTPAPST